MNNVNLTCTACGHVNRPGELACAECGKLLAAGPVTRVISFTEDALKIAVGPTGKALIDGQRSIVLKIGGEKVIIQLSNAVTVGRQAEGGKETPPDVDLAAYGAAEKGVSRQHIKITLKNEMVYVTDLRSTNGTRLNGQSILPNSARLVRDGDELQLGSLRMIVSFESIG